jgi:protein-tyrosine phosphatase
VSVLPVHSNHDEEKTMTLQRTITRIVVAVVVTSLVGTSMAAAGQAGVTGATVTRSGNDFVLTWTTSGPVPIVRIKQGTDPAAIDTLVATITGGTSTTVTGLDPAQRHYFRVKGGSGDGAIAAERVVPQTGVLNFRDTGGYTVRNPGGHTKSVRWGLFFRAGAPSPTSNQAFLSTLDIQTIVDARAPAEIGASRPAWSSALTGATVVSTPIIDEGNLILIDLVAERLCTAANGYVPFQPECFAAQETFFGPQGQFWAAFNEELFRGFVSGTGPQVGSHGQMHFGDAVNHAVRTLLLLATDSANLPLLWADTNGGARAGFGAAVLAMALGVEEADVIADFVLTNTVLAPVIAAQLAQIQTQLVNTGLLKSTDLVAPRLTLTPAIIQAVMDEMVHRYGSVWNYLSQGLGITEADLEAMRANLLKG